VVNKKKCFIFFFACKYLICHGGSKFDCYFTILKGWGTIIGRTTEIKERKELETKATQRQQVNQQNTSGLC